MITVNLLPDIKSEYIKARRSKRVIMALSVLISASLIGVVVIGFFVTSVVQQRHLTNLSEDIQAAVNTIKSTEDLDKILTVNEQLTELPILHGQKPISSRIFQYLSIMQPEGVDISELTIELDDFRMTINGKGDDRKLINVFADTLKNANYKIDSESESVKAFEFVEITSYGSSEADGGDSQVTFTMDLGYDSEIFSVANEDIKVSVPEITSTSANLETPNLSFDRQPDNEGEEQ